MRSLWTIRIIVGFITMAGCWMPFVPAVDVQHVTLGSNVTLGCNFSYTFETTWLKHNPDLVPTVVLCASLREGQPVQRSQLSPHYTVTLVGRSLALTISDIEEEHLGLYYCIANVKSFAVVGVGTTIQVSSQDSSAGSSVDCLPFHHWYCVVGATVLLIMMLAICVTHWKTKQRHQRMMEVNVPRRY